MKKKKKKKKHDLKWSYLVIMAVHCVILQMLHLQIGPNHVLIYSLNSVIDVKDFTLEGSWFRIFRPKAIKPLSPYFVDFWCRTKKSLGLILRSLFGVFMKLGLILLTILKNYIAKVRNLLLSMVVVIFVFNKVA